MTLSARLQAAQALIRDRGLLPGGPAIDGHPAVAELGGREAALAYLHGCWVTHFGVALDEELDAQPVTGAEAAWRAWQRVSARHPGLVRILVHYRREEVVRKADARHSRLLGEATASDPRTLPAFARIPGGEEPAPLASARRAGLALVY